MVHREIYMELDSANQRGGWSVAYIKPAIQWDVIYTTDGRERDYKLHSLHHFRAMAEDV